MWSLVTFRLLVVYSLAILLSPFYDRLIAFYLLIIALIGLVSIARWHLDQTGFGMFVHSLLLLLLVFSLGLRQEKSAQKWEDGFYHCTVEIVDQAKGYGSKWKSHVRVLSPRQLHGLHMLWDVKQELCQAMPGLGAVYHAPVYVRSLPQNQNNAYYKYLESVQIRGFMHSGRNKPVLLKQVEKPFFSRLQDELLKKVEPCFDRKSDFGLYSAMALGVRVNLDKKDRKAFMLNGAMHILAVSGMHVGVLFAAIHFLWTCCYGSQFKWIKTLVSISIIWFYALLCASSPSVIRAAMMFSFIQLGNSFQRQINSLNLVFFAALIQLLLWPDDLYSVSFQLSYSAVLGILLFEPLLSRWARKWPKFPAYFYQLLTVSLAAQSLTLPIVLYSFGSYPIYSLFTNLLLIPLSVVQMLLGFVILGLSFTPFNLNLLCQCFTWLLWLMRKIMSIVDFLPMAQIQLNLSSQLLAVVLWILTFALGVLAYDKALYFRSLNR